MFFFFSFFSFFFSFLFFSFSFHFIFALREIFLRKQYKYAFKLLHSGWRCDVHTLASSNAIRAQVYFFFFCFCVWANFVRIPMPCIGAIIMWKRNIAKWERAFSLFHAVFVSRFVSHTNIARGLPNGICRNGSQHWMYVCDLRVCVLCTAMNTEMQRKGWHQQKFGVQNVNGWVCGQLESIFVAESVNANGDGDLRHSILWLLRALTQINFPAFPHANEIP